MKKLENCLLRRTALLMLLATSATVAQPSSVTPILNCVAYFADANELTAVFGYANTSGNSQTILVGSSNFMSPLPLNQGQPTTFLTGTNHNVWTATLNLNNADSLSWTLEGTTVTATNDPNTYCTTSVLPPGPQGPQGPQGAQGAAGPTGPAGPAGLAGPVGQLGAVGPIGPAGAAGPKGPTGHIGPIGPAGASGSQGPLGAGGNAGPPGSAGAHGPVGTQGPIGLQGAIGAAGPVGPAGPMGMQGMWGSPGPQGPHGVLPAIRIVNANAPSSATASCNTSEALLGGNGVCSASAVLTSSLPNGNGWSVSCNIGQATAAAVCVGLAAGLTNQTISFANPGNQLYGTTFALTASSSSGLPVTFTSLTPATCTLSTFIAIGPCTIQANQAGNATYAGARPVIETFTPYVDVSPQVSITQNGFGRNRATGIWSATLTVTNTSTAMIGGPIDVVIGALSSNATMVNMTGTHAGLPYVTLSNGALAAGAAVSAIIEFTNPSNGYITYTAITYSGVF